jgi:hypothetical protein
LSGREKVGESWQGRRGRAPGIAVADCESIGRFWNLDATTVLFVLRAAVSFTCGQGPFPVLACHSFSNQRKSTATIFEVDL